MRLIALTTLVALASAVASIPLGTRAVSSVLSGASIIGNAVGYTVCLINYEVVVAANLLGLKKPTPACTAQFNIGSQSSNSSPAATTVIGIVTASAAIYTTTISQPGSNYVVTSIQPGTTYTTTINEIDTATTTATDILATTTTQPDSSVTTTTTQSDSTTTDTATVTSTTTSTAISVNTITSLATTTNSITTTTTTTTTQTPASVAFGYIQFVYQSASTTTQFYYTPATSRRAPLPTSTAAALMVQVKASSGRCSQITSPFDLGIAPLAQTQEYAGIIYQNGNTYGFIDNVNTESADPQVIPNYSYPDSYSESTIWSISCIQNLDGTYPLTAKFSGFSTNFFSSRDTSAGTSRIDTLVLSTTPSGNPLGDLSASFLPIDPAAFNP